MRSSLIILFVFLTLNYLNAQQSQWLEGIHGTDNDVGTDVAEIPFTVAISQAIHCLQAPSF
jgi:hypothetical protein